MEAKELLNIIDNWEEPTRSQMREILRDLMNLHSTDPEKYEVAINELLRMTEEMKEDM